MIAITYIIQQTIYNRVATRGGMDSEFSHTSVEPRELTVVIPDDSPMSIMMAETWIRNYDGNRSDKEFKIISTNRMQIHTIIQSPLGKI